jgi:hypothetical protein
MDRARYAEVLRQLATSNVEFIVVGMLAGALRGAPVLTVDLDIVHRRSAENVARLLGVLETLDATYRHDPRGLRPSAATLMSPGHQLFATSFGDLDCLGQVGRDRGYEDLVGHAPQLTVGEGLAVHVIDLPTLIQLKEETGRPKDLAVLPVLRATLAESNRA